MKTSILKIGVFATALIALGAGCSAAATQGPDGGVIRSTDGGLTWQLKSDIYTVGGKVLSFNTTDVNTLVADPNDSRSFWAGTMTNGILYSSNGGEAWSPSQVYSPAELQLTQARVNGIAVDPTNSCAVYATITAPSMQSYLIRSVNCGHSWGLVYTNERAGSQLQAVAFNPLQNTEMYVGDSIGRVLRSTNAGGSWQPAGDFGGSIVRQIVMHPKHNGEIFVATRLGGLYHSVDHGVTWVRADFKAFRGADDVYQIVLDPAAENSLLVGTKYGILRSTDSGATWNALKLVTAANEVQIISLAVSPKNSQHIFYGTPTAFYKSEDGGVTWNNKHVPTHRVIRAILIDPAKAAADPETIFVAAWQLPQQ